MNEQRLIIEMGSGVDLLGGDYTKAASRAIDDALQHSYLAILETLDVPHDDMRVAVTLGVQAPGDVDIAALTGKFPVGKVTITPVLGGMDVTDQDTGKVHVVASAAIEVFLPKQTNWRIKKTA